MLCATFYQSTEGVPDPRGLRSEKKNLWYLMICFLKNKTPANRVMPEEDTATLIVSTLLKTISSSHAKQSERMRISCVCFRKP